MKNPAAPIAAPIGADEPRDAPTIAVPPRDGMRARRFGRGMALALAAAVLTAAAGVAAWALTRPQQEPVHAAPPAAPVAKPDRTTVPRVVGYKETRALVVLGEAHLDAKIVRRATEQPTGLVLSQKPAEGTEVDRDTKVVIVVDEGAPPVRVPAVTDRAFSDAAAALRRAGLRPRKTETASDREPGTVLEQHPAAGEQAKKGATVVLTVAKAAPVPVPSVVGLAASDAEAQLRAAGFGFRAYTVPSKQPKGTVVSQGPVAGATAPRGSFVRINLSQGPPTATPSPKPAGAVVPDVTGEDEQSARLDLQAAGFQVRVVDQPTADPAQDGIVEAQDPQGGRAPSGSTVTITVGRLS